MCRASSKALYSPDIVMVLYILNLIMVTTDFLLYLRNAKEQKQKQGQGV